MGKLQDLLSDFIDFIFSFFKYPIPVTTRNLKIIAHRGWHRGKIIENTIPAFEAAQKAGVWGIEFDVRWTKDLVPVIHHDASTERIWGRNLVIADCEFSELRSEIPEIPTLEEVVRSFGGRIHFFIELKWEVFPHPEKQISILKFLLKNLKPVEDYHFLTLEPDVYDIFCLGPTQCRFLVGTTNISKISQLALKGDFGGVMGHYLLFRKSLVGEHFRAGHQIGTGYIRDKNVLVREKQRGVEFFFTNHPWNLVDQDGA